MADKESGKGDLEGSSWGGREDLETPQLALIHRGGREMQYVSLHHHSTFSFLDGFGLPKSHVHRAVELGMPALALTEHGNVSSHAHLAEAAATYGIKPIFGCELYCGAVDDDRTQRKNHLTVLARNAVGYRNLLKVVSQGWEDFYYEPTVSGASLARHREGLIILSGCTGSLLATSLVGGKNVPVEKASYARGRNVARRFKRAFGDAYYLEVQMFPELENVCRINVLMERLARELHIPLVATGDCHYTRPEEAELQMVLHSIGRHKTPEQLQQNWGYDVPLAHALSDELAYKKLRATGLSKQGALEAIASTAEIGKRCSVELPTMGTIRFPIPRGLSRDELWRQWIKEGWSFRGFGRLGPRDAARYRAQLQKEMEVIEGKDFVDYFLFTSDIVKYAKDHGILVGPGRGSAAASLVCFLLRITEVDPLKFPNLMFERFVAVDRDDIPDIDLDFDDERRHEVFEYAERKYGKEYVGRIGSLIKFKSKNSLDDIGKVFKIPPWKVDVIKDLLIERSSGDLRASATIEDTKDTFEEAKEVFDEYPELLKAMALEGNIKGVGIHSAGLVVGSEPITNVCAVYTRTDHRGETRTDEWGNPMRVVSFDKYSAERYNLLKMDILGLSNMGLLSWVMKFTGMTVQDFYDLPLDDPKVLAGFTKNDCIGIFQFDGWATRSVNGSLKAETFDEIADVNALARPGPLHSGAAERYVAIKRGEEEVLARHPLLDPIVAPTKGQIVYQEQILRIVTEIGKFDWTHAGYIRRIISRKIGEQEFQRQYEKFKKGARENGLEDALIDEIWASMITAGSYAFCPTGDMVLMRGSRGSNGGGEVTVAELWRSYNSNTSLGHKLRYGQNGKRITLQAMDDDGRIRPKQFLKIERSEAMVPVVRVHMVDGTSFRCSESHIVMTAAGYKRMSDLLPGAELISLDADYRYKQKSTIPASERSGNWKDGKTSWHADGRQEMLNKAQKETWDKARGECQHCGKKDDGSSHCLEVAHILDLVACDGDIEKYHNVLNMLLLCNSCHKKFDYAKGERHKRDTVGRPVVAKEIDFIELDGVDYVYSITMNDHTHNFVGNNIVHHNNFAHCVSYGMIAYWTMWVKVYHPSAFYAAALRKMPSKAMALMRDAEAHDIKVLPPMLNESEVSWVPGEVPGTIVPGFAQIPGIGLKTARALVAYRSELEEGFTSWTDLSEVKGIGAKTVSKIADFAGMDDPFEIHALEKKIESVKDAIRRGQAGFRALPFPTHTVVDVPAEKGRDEEVVWIGTVHARNVRDLFEVNSSKGEQLKPEEVKDPHLREWVIMYVEDQTDQMSIKVNRWRYPAFKKSVFSIDLDHDIVLVRGIKRGYINRRMLDVMEMWVISPDDEKEAVVDEDLEDAVFA